MKSAQNRKLLMMIYKPYSPYLDTKTEIRLNTTEDRGEDKWSLDRCSEN